MNLKIFHPEDRRGTRGITGRYDKNPGALKQLNKACCTRHKRATTKNDKSNGKVSMLWYIENENEKNIAVLAREKVY